MTAPSDSHKTHDKCQCRCPRPWYQDSLLSAAILTITVALLIAAFWVWVYMVADQAIDRSIGKHINKLELPTTLKQTINNYLSNNLASYLDESVKRHIDSLKTEPTNSQSDRCCYEPAHLHDHIKQHKHPVSIKLPTTLEQTLKTAVEDGFAEGLKAMQKHLDRCLEQHNEKSCQFWQVIDRRVKHLECKLDKCPKGKACAAKAPKECSKATKP